MASDNLKAIPTDMSAHHCGEGTSRRKAERLVSPVLEPSAGLHLRKPKSEGSGWWLPLHHQGLRADWDRDWSRPWQARR